MEEEIHKISILANEVTALAKKLKVMLANRPVPKELRDSFNGLDVNASELANSFKYNDAEKIIHFASQLGIYAMVVGQHSQKLDDGLALAAGDLAASGENLRAAAENSTLGLKPLDVAGDSINFTPARAINDERIKVLYEEHEKHDQRVKKLLNENELRIAELEKSLKELGETAQGEIDKIKLAYSDGLREVEVKRTEIDEILGHVSGRAIAGDYAKSATDEKDMADWLRIGSLFCMGVIAASLIYSLFETIHSDFNWQQSLFRITLTFLLSVPAAYLARESAKHREQQYQHQQTSLDLKALSPFVASLPDEEQHKIKIAIASKIFAGRDFSKVGADSYPINTQEILMEIIKKLDVSKKPEKNASE